MTDNDNFKGFAEIQYSMQEKGPVFHVSVPKGMRVTDLTPITDILSKELIPKLVPRGCQACLSGADFHIRERLENVLHIDLQSGKFHKFGK